METKYSLGEGDEIASNYSYFSVVKQQSKANIKTVC